MNIPALQPRGPAPAVAPSRFDIPVIVKREHAPGPIRTEVSVGYQRSSVANDRHAEFDMTLAREVGRTLLAHYPGHFWAVECDSKQGICTITIPILLGNWKYIIPLTRLNPQMVLRAGGEILERFKIPRSSLDLAAFLDARKKRVSRASQKPPV